MNPASRSAVAISFLKKDASRVIGLDAEEDVWAQISGSCAIID
jgi:hypothetical protein